MIALLDDRPYWWTVIPFGVCVVGAFRAYTLPTWKDHRGLTYRFAVQAFALTLTWVSGMIALCTIVKMILGQNQLPTAPIEPVPEVSLGLLLAAAVFDVLKCSLG